MCVGFASHRVIQIVTVLPALAAAMAVGLASAGAEAADLPQSYKAAPSYTTPQPAFSWTGFYAGFNAGGGQSSDNAYNSLLGVSGGRLRGALAGLEGGYNYQLSPMFVVSIENDLDWTGLSNHNAWNSPAVSVPWMTTGRARAGVTVLDPHLLLYGTAGLATAELKDGPINKMKMGWTTGGGVEWAFLAKWSAKVEYLYTDLKRDKLPDWNEAKFHTVRVGLNYHFDLSH
jgi:outer membrane immunogenic protein